MPGLTKDSVDVRVDDGHLIVEAERTRSELPKEAQVHLSERTYGPIRRTFKMPEDALTDGINASYRDGILDVRVPKKPETKPLRIKVNAD
jgi:HSP20 family protein